MFYQRQGGQPGHVSRRTGTASRYPQPPDIRRGVSSRPQSTAQTAGPPRSLQIGSKHSDTAPQNTALNLAASGDKRWYCSVFYVSHGRRYRRAQWGGQSDTTAAATIDVRVTHARPAAVVGRDCGRADVARQHGRRARPAAAPMEATLPRRHPLPLWRHECVVWR